MVAEVITVPKAAQRLRMEAQLVSGSTNPNWENYETMISVYLQGAYDAAVEITEKTIKPMPTEYSSDGAGI